MAPRRKTDDVTARTRRDKQFPACELAKTPADVEEQRDFMDEAVAGGMGREWGTWSQTTPSSVRSEKSIY